MRPEPVYMVRCTARGCDWSVTSNVAKRLGQFWRWHAADSHPKRFARKRNPQPVVTPVEKASAS